MNLDEGQKQKVRQWIEEGLKLSEIQNKLSSEFGVSMTYMEMRFLMDDLKLLPKNKEPLPPPPAPPTPEAKATPAVVPPGTEKLAAPLAGAGLDAAADPIPSKVAVTVDKVTRPGSMVSGKVTFSDSQEAEWYLDQFGRLGLVAKQAGYRPPQEDLMEFQATLQDELARMGMA